MIKRELSQLFPASIEEQIDVEDPVRAYHAFVEALNFGQLGIVVDPYRAGHPQFDPRATVKLLAYEYLYAIRSINT